ncbi:MAG: hypothetical protein KA180_13430 [Gemmatimonadales bacterium]|nr:hypothetical protein [Gemmatimonadales bacterium]MBP9202158.1 hypothetical protein [Gemmatimonadales bacterium]
MATGGNITWGIRWGLAFAACYAVIGSAIVLLRGDAPLRSVGLTPWTLIVGYLAGGVLAGAVVGAGRPLLRRGAGAAVVGACAADPIAVTFLLLMDDGRGPLVDARFVFVAVVFSVVVGPLAALRLGEVFSDPEEP